MSDVFTTVSDLNSAGTTAYEQLAYFALRPALYFDACASVRPTRQSHRGSVVTFNIYNDLAPNITPLSETEDVDAVAVSDNIVTVALNEYGNAAITTAAARGYSYLVISEDVANVVGWNAGISFDSLARNVLIAGSNVLYGGGQTARGDLTATDLLTASLVRRVGTELEDASVQPVMNGFYKAFASPRALLDLREESGPGNWRDPHVYSQPEQIWNGETGAFESFSFISTPRLSATNLEPAQGGPGGFVDGGSGVVDVFPTLFLGNQALAKTFSTMTSSPIPNVILGLVTDKLKRFVPIGWYWNGGYGRFREAALWRVETASTAGTNV